MSLDFNSCKQYLANAYEDMKSQAIDAYGSVTKAVGNVSNEDRKTYVKVARIGVVTLANFYFAPVITTVAVGLTIGFQFPNHVKTLQNLVLGSPSPSSSPSEVRVALVAAVVLATLGFPAYVIPGVLALKAGEWLSSNIDFDQVISGLSSYTQGLLRTAK